MSRLPSRSLRSPTCCHSEKVGNLVFVSGLIGNTSEDPLGVVPGGVEEQTRQTLRNMAHILQEAGCSLANVVRATVLLTDIADFVRVNNVYREFFPDTFPARAAYQVVALPNPKALVEIEAVAVVAGEADKRIIIQTAEAPVSSAPLSQAVQVGDLVFLSGQVGTRPEHPTQLVAGGLETEARQVFANLGHILKAANCSFADVVKTNLLLADIADFDRVNAIYRENFKSDLPARAAYQAAALPLGALVEIEAVAVVASAGDSAKKVVWTGLSPTPLAPKSQAIQGGGWLHISGQQGQTLENPSHMLGDVEAEARQALTNMGLILQAANCTFKNVVKTTIFLSDVSDFSRVNNIYKEFFTQDFPARAAYQVAGIPLAGKIQIDAVAALGIC